MGHVIFIILHIVAVLFGLIGLFLTIPLHIIYAVISKKPVNKYKYSGRRCPFCKEMINKEAIVCNKCHSDLKNEDVITYDFLGNEIINDKKK